MPFKPYKPTTANRFVMHSDGRIGITIQRKGPDHWIVAFVENGPLEKVPLSQINIATTGGPEGNRLREYAKTKIAELSNKEYPSWGWGPDWRLQWPKRN